MVHQRGPGAELAEGILNRQRAKHERRDAAGADVPQPQRTEQFPLCDRREGKAFGGRTSVTQVLAGAQMAVVAKAHIKQRFTRNDVRSLLRTDRERSGSRGEGKSGLPRGSHGTSVSTARGRHAALVEWI
jgi:hypothetical protein